MPSSVVTLTMTQNAPPIPFGGTVTQVRMSLSFMCGLLGSRERRER